MGKIRNISLRGWIVVAILSGWSTSSLAHAETCKSAHQELLRSLDKVGDDFDRLEETQVRVERIIGHLERVQGKTFRMAESSEGIGDFQKQESQRALSDLDQATKIQQTLRHALDQSFENFTHKSSAFEKLCFKR